MSARQFSRLVPTQSLKCMKTLKISLPSVLSHHGGAGDNTWDRTQIQARHLRGSNELGSLILNAEGLGGVEAGSDLIQVNRSEHASGILEEINPNPRDAGKIAGETHE